MDLEKVLTTYIECALWSSTDDTDEPFDANYSRSDIADEALASMKSDCEDFITNNTELLENMTDEQAGHDFWLTRNRHGAGFWDRGLGEVGDTLTEHAHTYGSSDLYLGDDGKLYVS